MSRSKLVVDRIRTQIPITDVLAHYGYKVRDGGYREQQFSCDLHGSGRDLKPSARVYPESASWYCYACGRTRDAIETVKEKENLSFWDAVRVLERRYGLEPLPVEAGYEYDDPTQAMQDGMRALDPVKTFADDSKRVRALLDGVLSPPCAFSMDEALTLWETFDMIQFKVLGPKGTGGDWNEQRGRGVLDVLRQRVLQRLGRS